jgi:hypothetical protein
MTLLQLKTFMQHRGVVTLNQLASVFVTDPKTIRLMMNHWIEAGKVKAMTQCGDCHGCLDACEAYEWV